jgi:hypothetical protein
MAWQTLSRVGRSALLLGAAVPAVATAQLYGISPNYVPQQQPATDQVKADPVHSRLAAKRVTANAAARRAEESDSDSPASGLTHIPAHSDDFAGKKVPKYRLQNGVTLQVSGGFRPSDTAHCTSNCFVPLQPRA